MNIDIVNELRDWAHIVDQGKGSARVVMLGGGVFHEAANEIERLRDRADYWKVNYHRMFSAWVQAVDEIERLRGSSSSGDSEVVPL